MAAATTASAAACDANPPLLHPATAALFSRAAAVLADNTVMLDGHWGWGGSEALTGPLPRAGRATARRQRAVAPLRGQRRVTLGQPPPRRRCWAPPVPPTTPAKRLSRAVTATSTGADAAAGPGWSDHPGGPPLFYPRMTRLALRKRLWWTARRSPRAVCVTPASASSGWVAGGLLGNGPVLVWGLGEYATNLEGGVLLVR